MLFCSTSLNVDYYCLATLQMHFGIVFFFFFFLIKMQHFCCSLFWCIYTEVCIDLNMFIIKFTLHTNIHICNYLSLWIVLEFPCILCFENLRITQSVITDMHFDSFNWCWKVIHVNWYVCSDDGVGDFCRINVDKKALRCLLSYLFYNRDVKMRLLYQPAAINAVH